MEHSKASRVLSSEYNKLFIIWIQLPVSVVNKHRQTNCTASENNAIQFYSLCGTPQI